MIITIRTIQHLSHLGKGSLASLNKILIEYIPKKESFRKSGI